VILLRPSGLIGILRLEWISWYCGSTVSLVAVNAAGELAALAQALITLGSVNLPEQSERYGG
jgi:hypothetical protein